MQLPLRYGAYSGLAMFAAFVAFYYFGYMPLGKISWLAVWIPLLFMYFTIKDFKQDFGGGYISFGIAYRLGFRTAMLSAAIGSTLSYSFAHWFTGNKLLLWYKQEINENMQEAPDALRNFFGGEGMRALDNMSVGSLMLSDYFVKIIGGVFSALLLAAILQSKNPEPDEQLQQEEEI